MKELFQGMKPPGSAILQGTVTKDDPLEITAVNDSKLIISGNQLVVPWHLTDYTTHADYPMGDKGELRDETYTKMDGGHIHNDSRGGPTTNVKHKHYLEKLNAYKMTLKVYNHLQKDDMGLFSFPHFARTFQHNTEYKALSCLLTYSQK